MSYQQKLKNNVWLLQAFNFVNNFTLFTAITMVYFVRVTGSYALGISLFSAMQITKALFEVPSGVWSDTWGRRKCLIIGTCLSTAALTCYALAQSYWLLLVGACLYGVSWAFFSGNNDALLFDSLAEVNQKEKYEEELGKLRSNAEASWLVSGIIGGFIAQWSFPLIMWLSILPQLLSLWMSFQVVEPQIHREKIADFYSHLKEAVLWFKTNTQLRRLSLADMFGVGIGESAWPFSSAFYSTLLPVWAVSILISMNFFFSAVGYRLSGKVLKKFPAIKVILFDAVYGRVLRIIALIHPTVVSPFLMAASAALFGPVTIATNSLMNQQFTDRQRATMASLNSLAGSILYSIFGVVFGIAADKFGIAHVLLLTQFISLPIVWWQLQIYWASKRK